MTKINIKQKSVIFLTFILGIILSINIKSLNPNNTFVSLKSVKEMENQINIERIEIENTNKLILQKKSDLGKYEIALKKHGSINNIVKSELEDVKMATGFKSVKGEGIIIELKDSERELQAEESPNSIVVHDIDIVHVVNDLKNAGAEAISINGERVIATSEIKCSGPTITINGTTYGQPFIIMAIGNVKFLQAAINDPLSYTYSLLKPAISVKYHISKEVIIPAYDKEMNFKYLKEGD